MITLSKLFIIIKLQRRGITTATAAITTIIAAITTIIRRLRGTERR